MTPIFVLGLAALLAAYERAWHKRKVAIPCAVTVLTLFAAWNLGLIFQWGTHLIADRGPISWSEMASNQFRVVPENVSSSVARYFTSRHQMMQSIEKKDLHQLGESDPSEGAPKFKK